MSDPFTLGQKVQFRPHHPGNVWEARPYWIHSIHSVLIWGSQRNPVTLYTVSEADDPAIRDKQRTPMVHATQLRPWDQAEDAL